MIRSEPKVSIIIPFYNVEPYIDQCIRSVLTQTYSNIEIILVDDASLDRSRAIADRLASEDPRVRIIAHEENRGLGRSRNAGARQATGAYLFFIDSDDYLSSSAAISTLMSKARRTKQAIIVGGSVKLMPDGTMHPYDQLDDEGSRNKSGSVVKGIDAFLSGLRIPCDYYLPLRAWGMLIDRSLYDSFDLEFPSGEHEDMAHTPFLYYQSGGVLYTQDIVVTYRVRPGSISNSRWSCGRLARYDELWALFKERVARFGLDQQLGNAALAFTAHLVWKLETVGVAPSARHAAVSLIDKILRDAAITTSSQSYLFEVLDRLRNLACEWCVDRRSFAHLVRSIPPAILLDYFNDRLNTVAESSKTCEIGEATADRSPSHSNGSAAQLPEDRLQSAEAHLSESLLMCSRYLTALSAQRRTGARQSAPYTDPLSPGQVHRDRARELEAANEALHAILRSSSWRLTAPLRRLMIHYPRFRAAARAILAPLGLSGHGGARRP